MAAGDVNASTEQLRWDLLEAEPPGGERLTVRAALPKRRADVLIGVDAARRRYVLIEVPESERTQLVERTSRGIAVRTVEMNVGGGRLLTYVEISCLEPQGHAALDIVVCGCAGRGGKHWTGAAGSECLGQVASVLVWCEPRVAVPRPAGGALR